MSAAELLALREQEALAMVQIVGITYAAPGETTTTFVDAQPGRYFAACFLPEGTTPTAEGHGPPHFTPGMLEEFTVG
jgi:type II secretory pathway component PulK